MVILEAVICAAVALKDTILGTPLSLTASKMTIKIIQVL